MSFSILKIEIQVLILSLYPVGSSYTPCFGDHFLAVTRSLFRVTRWHSSSIVRALGFRLGFEYWLYYTNCMLFNLSQLLLFTGIIILCTWLGLHGYYMSYVCKVPNLPGTQLTQMAIVQHLPCSTIGFSELSSWTFIWGISNIAIQCYF